MRQKCSQRAVPSSLGLTSELAEKRTCQAKNGLVSTSNIAGIDAIYRFSATALVLAKGFAVGGAVGSVPVPTVFGKTATENRESSP